MKSKLLSTVILVSVLAALPACSARPRSHLHHRNDRLPRDVRAAPASSESSLIEEGPDGLCDPNNILAHAVAGIPLEEGACSPPPPANNSSVVVAGPATSPAINPAPSSVGTATLQDRGTHHWTWGHGQHRGQAVRTVVQSLTKSALTYVTTTASASSPTVQSNSSVKSSAQASTVTVDPIAASTSSVAVGFDGSYQSFVMLPGFDGASPASTSSAASSSPSSLCPGGNGTTYTSKAKDQYKVICDVDYVSRDLPFQLVRTFDDCVSACDAYNTKAGSTQCIAALFVPSRATDTDDCYLKYSTDNPSAATVAIEGALLVTTSTTSTSQSSSTSSSKSSTSSSRVTTTSATSSKSSSTGSSSAAAQSTAAGSQPGITYASGNAVVVPKVSSTKLHGPSVNTPSKQYVQVPKVNTQSLLALSTSLLTVGVNGDLSTNYDISINSGYVDVNITTQSYLSSLKNTPHLSRDGGRGGYLNGQHLFIFCDTGSYSTTSADTNGNFLGFTSSSVAVDVGMNGLNSEPLNIQDGIGAWSDNAGRQRSFSPLTRGEEAYNQVMQGMGQRYAIWPESAIIPLDATSALIYAPIVYDNVNQNTKAAVFTYTGATLLQITAGGKGGPVASRINRKIFDQGEVEWGCAGGIRSWGASGIGGDDGSVYVFGNVNGGILLARTSPSEVADRNSYEYWNGKSWTSSIQPSTSKAYFINGPIMDIDVFYSPRHLTFIAVYLTIYADSTFYYRYLEADGPILPPFAPGGDKNSDYVENILKYTWSEQQVLYKAATGLSGKYIYSGGLHAGYYGSNDITNGGSRMLISWTAPTGLDPSTLDSEYQIVTAEIDWA